MEHSFRHPHDEHHDGSAGVGSSESFASFFFSDSPPMFGGDVDLEGHDHDHGGPGGGANTMGEQDDQDDDQFAVHVPMKFGPASKRRRTPLASSSSHGELLRLHDNHHHNHHDHLGGAGAAALLPKLGMEEDPLHNRGNGGGGGGNDISTHGQYGDPRHQHLVHEARMRAFGGHPRPTAAQIMLLQQQEQQQQQLQQHLLNHQQHRTSGLQIQHQQQKQQQQQQQQQKQQHKKQQQQPKLKRKTRTPKGAKKKAGAGGAGGSGAGAGAGSKKASGKGGGKGSGAGSKKAAGAGAGGGSGVAGNSRAAAAAEQKERRIKHNAAERTRTRTISQKIKRLHDLLQQEGRPVKNEKLHIITEALDYIKQLTARLEAARSRPKLAAAATSVATAGRVGGEAQAGVGGLQGPGSAALVGPDLAMVKTEPPAPAVAAGVKSERAQRASSGVVCTQGTGSSSGAGAGRGTDLVSGQSESDVSRLAQCAAIGDAVRQELAPYVVLGLDLRVLFCSPQFSSGLLRLTRRPQLDCSDILTLLYGSAPAPPPPPPPPTAQRHGHEQQPVQQRPPQVGEEAGGGVLAASRAVWDKVRRMAQRAAAAADSAGTQNGAAVKARHLDQHRDGDKRLDVGAGAQRQEHHEQEQGEAAAVALTKGGVVQVVDYFVVPGTRTRHWFRLDVSAMPLAAATARAAEQANTKAEATPGELAKTSTIVAAAGTGGTMGTSARAVGEGTRPVCGGNDDGGGAWGLVAALLPLAAPPVAGAVPELRVVRRERGPAL